MTPMSEGDLDGIYGELCRALTDVGKERAPLLLARFALLAIGEIGDVERVRRILASARVAANDSDQINPKQATRI